MQKNTILLYIAAILLLLSSAGARAGDFNPPNPPDPQLRYKLTVAVYPEGAGSVSGGGMYVKGASVRVSTSAYSGYVFSHWRLNGDSTTYGQSFYYNMPDEPVSFVAVYKSKTSPDQPQQPFNPSSPQDPAMPAIYRLYLETNADGCCTFNITSGLRQRAGQYIYVSAQNVKPGYQFQGWFQEEQKVSNNLSFNYLMPYADVHLSARFVYEPTNPNDPASSGIQTNIDNRGRGDLNADEKVDFSDALMLLGHLQSQSVWEVPTVVGDINEDGIINANDILAVLNDYLTPLSVLYEDSLAKVNHPFYEEANALIDQAQEAITTAEQGVASFDAFVQSMASLSSTPNDSTTLVAAIQSVNNSIASAQQAIATAKLALAAADTKVKQEAKAAEERKQTAATVVATADALDDEPLVKGDNWFYDEANQLVDKANAAIAAAQQTAADFNSLVNAKTEALRVMADKAEIDAALEATNTSIASAQQAIATAKMALATAAQNVAKEKQAAQERKQTAATFVATADALDDEPLVKGDNPFYEEANALVDKAIAAIAATQKAAADFASLVNAKAEALRVMADKAEIEAALQSANANITSAQQAIATAKMALAAAASNVAQENKAAKERKQTAASVVASAAALNNELLTKVDNPFYEEANALVDKANEAILAAQKEAASFDSLVNAKIKALRVAADKAQIDAALQLTNTKIETAEMYIQLSLQALADAAARTGNEAQAAQLRKQTAATVVANADALDDESLAKGDNWFYDEANKYVDKANATIAAAQQAAAAFESLVNAKVVAQSVLASSDELDTALQLANDKIEAAQQAIATAKMALAAAASNVAQEAKAAQERKQTAATVVATANALDDEPLIKGDNPFYKEANALVDKANAAIAAAQQAAAAFDSLVNAKAEALRVMADKTEIDAALEATNTNITSAQQAIATAKIALATADTKVKQEAKAAEERKQTAATVAATADALDDEPLVKGDNWFYDEANQLVDKAIAAIAAAQQAAADFASLVNAKSKALRVTADKAEIDAALEATNASIASAQQAIATAKMALAAAASNVAQETKAAQERKQTAATVVATANALDDEPLVKGDNWFYDEANQLVDKAIAAIAAAQQAAAAFDSLVNAKAETLRVMADKAEIDAALQSANASIASAQQAIATAKLALAAAASNVAQETKAAEELKQTAATVVATADALDDEPLTKGDNPIYEEANALVDKVKEAILEAQQAAAVFDSLVNAKAEAQRVVADSAEIDAALDAFNKQLNAFKEALDAFKKAMDEAAEKTEEEAQAAKIAHSLAEGKMEEANSLELPMMPEDEEGRALYEKAKLAIDEAQKAAAALDSLISEKEADYKVKEDVLIIWEAAEKVDALIATAKAAIDTLLARIESGIVPVVQKQQPTIRISGKRSITIDNLAKATSIVVFDLSGRLVQKRTASSPVTINLPKGQYVVKVEERSFKIVL